jgi:DNA-binding response OmpR family regulator
MNGPDATAEIRSIGFSGLVFGLTGNLLQEDIDYFIMKGADDVFPKPFNPSILNKAWEEFS